MGLQASVEEVEGDGNNLVSPVPREKCVWGSGIEWEMMDGWNGAMEGPGMSLRHVKVLGLL